MRLWKHKESDKSEAAIELWLKAQGPTYSAPANPTQERHLQRTPTILEHSLKIPEKGYLEVKTMPVFWGFLHLLAS